MKFFFQIIGVFILVSLVGLGIKILFFPINTAEKLVDTAYNIQSKTLNADNAIYNYEYFRQAAEEIRATENKIRNARTSMDGFSASAGARTTWTFEDKQEDARLRSVVLGLENYYESIVADYNAKSKMANRAIFRDALVPDYFDAMTFLKR